MTNLEASVIIPNFNGARQLEQLLTSLSVQTCGPDTFEIILVDDGSVDDSVALAKSKAPNNLIVVEQKNRGPAAARNTGSKSASSEIFIFLDSDFVVRNDFIKGHVTARRKCPGGIISGMAHWRYVVSFLDNELVSASHGLADFAEAKGWNFDDPFSNERTILGPSTILAGNLEDYEFRPKWVEDWGYERIVDEFGMSLSGFFLPWLAVCAGNFSIPKQAFISLNGFDEDLRCFEDWDLGLRFHRSGGEIVFDLAVEGFQQLRKVGTQRRLDEAFFYKRWLEKSNDVQVALLSLLNFEDVGFRELSEIQQAYEAIGDDKSKRALKNILMTYARTKAKSDAQQKLLTNLERIEFELPPSVQRLIRAIKAQRGVANGRWI